MNKSILMTGATGFLGSHLLEELINSKYQVVILTRPHSSTSRIDHLLSKVKLYILDQTDYSDYNSKALSDIFSENNVLAIIHAATSYGNSEDSEYLVNLANVQWPLYILSLAVKNNVEYFVNTDTVLPSKCNIYSLTKSHLRQLGEFFTDRYKIKFINFKLQQIFGYDNNLSKFIPYVIHSCLNNHPELHFTSGIQERDFIYIKDVCSAYRLVIDKIYSEGLPEFYSEYELGSGKAIQLKEFIKIIHKITESKTRLNFGQVPYRKEELMFSEANIDRLCKIGWLPQFSLYEALSETIDTYKNIGYTA